MPAADELVDHTTDVTSRLGNNISRMEYVFEQFENTKITKKAEISKLVDTDYAQAISDRKETIINRPWPFTQECLVTHY